MNKPTKGFLTKLADLLEEYKANLEIESDSYSGGPMQITLELPNPQTFDNHYNNWIAENYPKKYPFDGVPLYKSVDYVDLGYHINAEKLKELIK